ncbi:MAG: hypothetical protein FJY85_09445 [Deltaproteobacteria bacterium]|nr:hypothetical protein [Deltaproteobacteria bacterium]
MASPFGASQAILLVDGEWYQIPTPRKLANMDAVLHRVYNKSIYTARNIHDGWNITFKPDGVVVHKPLPSLPLDTYWLLHKREDGSTFMVPDFARTGDSVRMKMTWKPPDTMRLIFLACYPDASQYMIAQTCSTLSMYKLPLGNLFSNGQICMGNSYRGPGANCDMIEASNAALNHFNSSIWNSDLSYNKHWAEELFAFLPNGTQVFTSNRWNNLCGSAVSSPEYNSACASYRG